MPSGAFLFLLFRFERLFMEVIPEIDGEVISLKFYSGYIIFWNIFYHRKIGVGERKMIRCAEIKVSVLFCAVFIAEVGK